MSKQEQLAAILGRDVHAGQYAHGAKLPSERELQNLYGVSRTVVRSVLAQLIREGLAYSVPGKGTFMGKSMDSGHVGRSASRLIALTLRSNLPSMPDSQDLISGIASVIEPAGYHLIVSSCGDRCAEEQKLIHNLILKNVDGLLITPVHEEFKDNRDLYAEMSAKSIPFVLVDRILKGAWANIAADSGAALAAGIVYLARQGHRRIAYIGPEQYPVACTRKEGYRTGLSQAGLPEDSRIIYSAAAELIWDPLAYGQAAATALLRSRVAFTALAGFSDQVLYGAWKVLRAKGWSPGTKRCLAGFYAMPISDADFQDHLVTFRRPTFAVGVAGAKEILRMIRTREPSPPLTRLVKCERVLPAIEDRRNPSRGLGRNPRPRGAVEA
jgi:DNA-binding LacI/PurR family transcriptional regulator